MNDTQRKGVPIPIFTAALWWMRLARALENSGLKFELVAGRVEECVAINVLQLSCVGVMITLEYRAAMKGARRPNAAMVTNIPDLYDRDRIKAAVAPQFWEVCETIRSCGYLAYAASDDATSGTASFTFVRKMHLYVDWETVLIVTGAPHIGSS